MGDSGVMKVAALAVTNARVRTTAEVLKLMMGL